MKKLLLCKLLPGALSLLFSSIGMSTGMAAQTERNESIRSLPARVVETLSASPRRSQSRQLDKAVPRPNRGWAAFGGSLLSPVEGRAGAFQFLGRFGVSHIPLRGTILDRSLNVTNVPLCGPSPETNTLVCYNVVNGELLEEVPIPGKLSTQPIFADGSWFFGTTKGFFVRTDGTTFHSTPLLRGENIGFWGSASRKMMKAMRPLSSIDGPELPTSPRAVYRDSQRPGWRWYTTSSAEFIGTPALFGSQLYVLSANQYLIALNAADGKKLWSVRLSPDSSLRLNGAPIAAGSKEVLAGTNDGQLIAINPKDGAVLWRYLVPTSGTEKFSAVVAPPTIIGRSIVFANSESRVTKLSLDGKTVEWSYETGSVAQIKQDESGVLVGGTKGVVHNLDLRSGALRWKTLVSKDTSIASIHIIKAQQLLLVADKKGVISALDSSTGTLLSQTKPTGEVVGEFFSGYFDTDACISSSNLGFRCYAAYRTAQGFKLAMREAEKNSP